MIRPTTDKYIKIYNIMHNAENAEIRSVLNPV